MLELRKKTFQSSKSSPLHKHCLSSSFRRLLAPERNPGTRWCTISQSKQTRWHGVKELCVAFVSFVVGRRDTKTEPKPKRMQTCVLQHQCRIMCLMSISVRGGFSRKTSSVFPEPKALPPVVTAAASCRFLRVTSPGGWDAESRNCTTSIGKPPIAVKKKRKKKDKTCWMYRLDCLVKTDVM